MRINIDSIKSLSINTRYLSMKASITNKDLSVRKINEQAPSGILQVGAKKYHCVLKSATAGKSNSILLHLDWSFPTISDLAKYVPIDKVELVLNIEEKVDHNLFLEAESLLKRAARLADRPKAELLEELTRYKNYEGKEELRFVSERQIVVLIRKLKQMLIDINKAKEGMQENAGSV